VLGEEVREEIEATGFKVRGSVNGRGGREEEVDGVGRSAEG
jgi:hypothetical protein